MKIGILAGTFDPIHNGHLALAQAAQKEVGLDKVYIMVEHTPRSKRKVTDFVQRQAMVEIALREKPDMDFLDLGSKQFSVAETWPKIIRRFEDAELFLIVGSDTFAHVDTWPGIEAINATFIVGTRSDDAPASKSVKSITLKTKLPKISSSQVRDDFAHAHGLINPVVGKYIETQKLYVD
jgi:nicotinate-nucleotide adenylyltransferase